MPKKSLQQEFLDILQSDLANCRPGIILAMASLPCPICQAKCLHMIVRLFTGNYAVARCKSADEHGDVWYGRNVQ